MNSNWEIPKIAQIAIGLALAVVCFHVPLKWIDDPHYAMFVGLLTGALTVEVVHRIERHYAEKATSLDS